nr:LacI family DNA-binding transcriptional regulator [Spelaeicoccus albus]
MPAGHASKPGRVTMVDVAARAGVSHQTVSRYMRHDGGLKPATSARIERAVAELGFRPDPIARSMRTRRSGRIALVLPEISDFVPADLVGSSAAAREAGYALDVVGLPGDEAARRARVIDLCGNDRVEGILAFTSISAPDSPSDALPPIVVVGEYDDRMRTTGAYADGALTADIVKHLASLGHRCLLHVAGPSDWASARNRRAVYLSAVRDLGLSSYGVVSGDWSVESGYRAAVELPVDSGVTAIVAANDHVAFGVLRGLAARGISVPTDMSVFGWDDVQIAAFTDPPLSTVAVDRAQLGRLAIERLIERIRGEPPKPSPTVPHGRLILRRSTGPAPR